MCKLIVLVTDICWQLIRDDTLTRKPKDAKRTLKTDKTWKMENAIIIRHINKNKQPKSHQNHGVDGYVPWSTKVAWSNSTMKWINFVLR